MDESVFSFSPVYAGDYVVTLTNLTRSQVFSPFIAYSHDKSLFLFRLGEPASDALAGLAQDADRQGLVEELTANYLVKKIIQAEDVLAPGQSSVFTISAAAKYRFLSLASMLVSTNDAFVALNCLKLPRHETTVYLYAYDAGTEDNDESCPYIPGPHHNPDQ